MSEKSINPSVTALAGSIKDNQSIGSSNDDNNSNHPQLIKSTISKKKFLSNKNV